ncbi:hypothetical protein SNOG_09931 [Parastagonospora nodorum SN15]|uniref:Uncharacterized protein n=1 Tax=Phaeosphaeria nodorum (strain SN15 / ATCC MYA-4574 / FGSC 10173) TaxID=321614 RepID=Q0UE83_PHANO|nr:hypothetical protein SNOG_09931 [Parastagonospora nodorum SN15]EAT82266.1 hypothetical protein SNOG_09931 [Parastagonospora nodorum SN15]
MRRQRILRRLTFYLKLDYVVVWRGKSYSKFGHRKPEPSR